MSRKVFIISGEPSGDLHGANLIKELKRQDPEIEIVCWGGDRMKTAGARVLKHIDELAFMGFVEVLANIFTIWKNFKLCEKQVLEFKPDAVILIDYPAFNLRMAKFLHGKKIPTHYYISPQIWAWKESRAKTIKAYIDRVFVILPFEESFYKKHGIEAQYVGHPLLDEMDGLEINEESFRNRHELDLEKPIIGVLPGSRSQEIKKILPIISGIVSSFPNHQVVVSKVSWLPKSLYSDYGLGNVKTIEANTYRLIANSEACIVTSGTATLETAIIGTPQVVVYRANAISVWLARLLVKVKYISLVNLILDRMAVTELIQGEVNPKRLISELKSILSEGEERSQILSEYRELHTKLGAGGASRIVANELLKSINQQD